MKSLVISPPPGRVVETRRYLVSLSKRVFWTSMLFGIPACQAFIFLMLRWQEGSLAARYYFVFGLPLLFPLYAFAMVARTCLPLGLRLDEAGISFHEGPFVRRIAWKRVSSIGFLRCPRFPHRPIFHVDSYDGKRIRFDVSREDVSQIESFVEDRMRSAM